MTIKNEVLYKMLPPYVIDICIIDITDTFIVVQYSIYDNPQVEVPNYHQVKQVKLMISEYINTYRDNFIDDLFGYK